MAEPSEIGELFDRIGRFWRQSPSLAGADREDWTSLCRKHDIKILNKALASCMETKPGWRPDYPEFFAAVNRFSREKGNRQPGQCDRDCTCGRCHYGPVWDELQAYGGWIDTGGTLQGHTEKRVVYRDAVSVADALDSIADVRLSLVEPSKVTVPALPAGELESEEVF